MTSRWARGWVTLLALGAVTGLLSGAFGIGGGVLLVPVLVGMLRFTHRMAAGTSLAAILPAAALGGIGYAFQGRVDWVAALCLAAGMIVGSQLGSYLLSRLPILFLQILFVTFLVVIIASLWIVIPQRDESITWNLLTGAFLVVAGFVTGVFSGLMGIGGGVIIVPLLMLLFGANDLEAKGTSLLTLVPGSISGTLANIRRHALDVRAAIILGISAGALSPIGAILAAMIDPFWSNAIFSLLLTAILLQMVLRLVRRGAQ